MIICPRCTRPLPEWLFRDSHIDTICPQCQAAVEIYSFPALYRSEEKLDASQLSISEGESCCYEHADKRAASLCSNCGRFLCALCEVQMGRQILCPDCLNGQKLPATQQGSLENHRMKYDSIALALAVWPLLIFYLTVITAPLAFIMAIYAWKKPSSIVRRSRWRIFAAMSISALEIAGMTALIVFFVTQVKGKLP